MFPTLLYVSQLCPPPPHILQTELGAIHKILHLPPQTFSYNLTLNLSPLIGFYIRSASTAMNASMIRFALKSFPSAGDLSKSLILTTLDCVPFKYLSHVNGSPLTPGWASPAYVSSLALTLRQDCHPDGGSGIKLPIPPQGGSGIKLPNPPQGGSGIKLLNPPRGGSGIKLLNPPQPPDSHRDHGAQFVEYMKKIRCKIERNRSIREIAIQKQLHSILIDKIHNGWNPLVSKRLGDYGIDSDLNMILLSSLSRN